MKVYGIDPGKAGAIAEIVEGPQYIETKPRIWPIPIVRATTGQGRDEYDVAGVVALFRDFLNKAEPIDLVVIEKPQPLPRFRTSDGFLLQLGGSIGNFNRGVQFGFAWMLEALRIPYQFVAPRTWQRVMLEGTPGDDTKQRSILAAQRLFPGVDLRRTERSRKADHGFSDSLLLAAYAKRILRGGTQ